LKTGEGNHLRNTGQDFWKNGRFRGFGGEEWREGLAKKKGGMVVWKNRGIIQIDIGGVRRYGCGHDTKSAGGRTATLLRFKTKKVTQEEDRTVTSKKRRKRRRLGKRSEHFFERGHGWEEQNDTLWIGRTVGTASGR